MKEVTLHQHEQARLHVLNSVLAEEITVGQAAALMDLSERHVRRLLAAYRELGAEALAHGNRNRRPHNAVPATIVRLAATRYPGANHTHLTELLEEHEDLVLSRSTVRRILVRAGMPSPRRRRPPRHRVRRERVPRAGMRCPVCNPRLRRVGSVAATTFTAPWPLSASWGWRGPPRPARPTCSQG